MSENTFQPIDHQKQDELLTETALLNLLETQREELKLRQEEMRLKSQGQQNDYEISRENLRLQAEYLRSAPKYMLRNRILVFILLTILVLVIASVFVYCIYLDKEEVSMRILEHITTTTLGVGGGYAWGKGQKPKREEAVPGEL
ncbi:hypothetical protein ACTJJB_21385 [Chitinophaga sp. 22536]|uniref:hypothetical protein n=1 Tax=unclassified Chitinophaga TaxID=2619133 RepID=UPI003F846139